MADLLVGMRGVYKCEPKQDREGEFKPIVLPELKSSSCNTSDEKVGNRTFADG
jgi:hypothetical protein